MFPFIGQNPAPENHQDFIQGSIEFRQHREVWRLYQSGLFAHLGALSLDSHRYWIPGNPPATEDGTPKLGFRYVIVLITEALRFASRLTTQLATVSSIAVTIRFTGLSGTELGNDNADSLPFMSPYRTDMDEYKWSQIISRSTINAEADALALDIASDFLARYRFNRSSDDLRDFQAKLMR